MKAALRALLRGEKSYGRKQGHKAPRALILIVCEDGKSSPAYFNDVRNRLRLSTAEVEICGEECGSAPINVVSFAAERCGARKKQGSAPDVVFCVVDVDSHSTLDAARDKAKAHKVDLIISHPCFERWYLLHYGPANAYVTRSSGFPSRSPSPSRSRCPLPIRAAGAGAGAGEGRSSEIDREDHSRSL